MPKKVFKKHTSVKSGDIKSYANSIEKFLKKTKDPYSETRLVEELFGIPLKKEGYVPQPKDVEKLRNIRQALRLLMNEKKVFGAKLEDPVTNEQVFHYSTKGWYATP